MQEHFPATPWMAGMPGHAGAFSGHAMDGGMPEMQEQFPAAGSAGGP
jgi:hypothetical protein